ncbi:MAG: hypothetical protein IPI02_20905 [Sterolibacteriaceae bacterium]|nr:hypothetical protein [Sterolibacteriaceae bacterium]
MQVKDNQKNLAEAIREFFEQGGKAGFGKLTVGRIEDIEKDHGRIWTRRYTWINDVSWMDKSMPSGKKLGGVGMIESVRQIGDEISVEHRYAIGSSGVQTVEMFARPRAATGALKRAALDARCGLPRGSVPHQKRALARNSRRCASLSWLPYARKKVPRWACAAAVPMPTAIKITVSP